MTRRLSPPWRSEKFSGGYGGVVRVLDTAGAPKPEFTSAFGGAADIDRPPIRVGSDAIDPLRKSGGPKCCNAQRGFRTPARFAGRGDRRGRADQIWRVRSLREIRELEAP
jgi:hypothetical protein